MSAAELRQAAETLRARAGGAWLGLLETEEGNQVLAELLDEFADAYEVLEEMYADADDAAEMRLRGWVPVVDLARLINGGAS